MPVYDYRCQTCEHEFELERKMKERYDETTCPKCGADDTEIAPPKRTGFVLKGTGWYATDYANKGK